MIVNERGRAKCVCNICKHSWFPRRQRGGNRYREPWKCPAIDCQSYLWNVDSNDVNGINMDLKIPSSVPLVEEIQTEQEIDKNELDNQNNNNEIINNQEMRNMVAGSDDYVKRSDVQHEKLVECINGLKQDGQCVKDDIKSLKDELVSLKTSSCTGEDCIKNELKSLKEDIRSLKGIPCPNCHKNSLHEYDRFCPLCGATDFQWIEE